MELKIYTNEDMKKINKKLFHVRVIHHSLVVIALIFMAHFSYLAIQANWGTTAKTWTFTHPMSLYIAFTFMMLMVPFSSWIASFEQYWEVSKEDYLKIGARLHVLNNPELAAMVKNVFKKQGNLLMYTNYRQLEKMSVYNNVELEQSKTFFQTK